MTQLLRATSRLWLLFAAFLIAQGAWAQTPVPLALQPNATYTESFADITNWTNGFASGTGANRFGSVGIAGTATIPNPTRTTTSSLSFTSSTSGGVQRGTGNLVLLSTGSTDNSSSVAVDFFVDFTGVNAGNLSFDAATVANATGNRAGTVKVYGSVDGTTFTDLGADFNAINNVTGTASLTVAIPATFNNVSTARFRLYYYNGGPPAATPTGSRPKISIDNLTVTGTTGPPAASLTANPTALTGLVATQGTVSNVQTYTLTGSTLDGNPVSVSATTNIELSTDNSTFTPTLSIPATTSAVSQVVYARLTNAAPTGPFSGTITNTANSTLTAAVTVSGQVNDPAAPALSVSPTTLSGFSTPQGTPSTSQTYSLTGVNLTNNVTITAPAGYEISLDGGTTFFGSRFVTGTGGAINTTVTVRLSGAGLAMPISGTITNVSGSLTANVAITGTVSSTSPYTSIANARAGIGQTFTIAGRVTASNQLGARQIYIQDATGGIAVYSGPSGPDFTTLVSIGDSVQTRGPVTVYQGYLEFTGTNNFTVVQGAGTVVPTPIPVTPDQLSDYQGRLVTITGANITPVAASFIGGTNYTITAGGQSSTLRISANSPLAGAGQPANPVSVTGISDRFVSGATTTGTNGLQIQPRILADIPGSTPATDLTCTVGSGSPLTRDQTLDIAAWNMEFFGADGGTISCPGGSTLVYNDMGPTNEDLQQTNATTVLTNLGADIISTEEVSDINRFSAAVAAIPGSYSYVCSDKFSYFFQNECDQVPSGNPPTVFGPTSLAQKVCVVYNTATVTPILAETKALLFQKTADYTYPGALGGNGSGNGWASGRLPFLFVANVTINGVTKKIHVVAVHGKSGSAKADFDRRVQDYNDLKTELDQNYSTANVIILGDYNDLSTGSIYTTSPVSSFSSLVTDVTNYSVITKPLEQNGCATYNPSGGSFIDQMVISNDLLKGYLANTAYVLGPFSIPNYTNTTSDHSPIVARFDISQLASPVSALTLVASANPTSILTTGTTTLSVAVSGGSTPYSYTFSGPGNITQSSASSNTAIVSGLTAGVQTFTVIAADATTPTAQTISATVSVTVNAPAPSQPVIAAVGPATVCQGNSLTIAATTGCNIGTLIYTYASDDNPTSTTASPADGNLILTATGAYTVTAACATTAATGPNSAPIQVQINTNPTVTITGGNVAICAGQSLTLGTQVNLQAQPSLDASPNPYSYVWNPSPVSQNDVAGSAVVQPLTTTAYTVKVTDANNCSVVSAPVSVTVNLLPPVAINPPAPTITPGSNVTLTASGADAYTWSTGSTTNPLIVGNVTSTTAFSVTGLTGTCSNTATATVSVTTAANTAPVATTNANQTATVGTAFSYTVNAFTDDTPNSLTYTASIDPVNGLSFDPTTRVVSGTPSTTGVSTVTITATDPGSLTASTTFTVTVSASATQPTGPATLTITSFNCFTTNGALSSVNFVVGYSDNTFSPALPPLFILGVTDQGQLGTPYTFSFDTNQSFLPVANNVDRSQVYFVWDFRSACATPVTPPAPTATVAPTLPNQTATVGTAFNYVVPAFTGTAPISYSATITPANGLSFDANTRTISGTPSMTGVSTVVISASNSVGTSTGQFTITVSASATQPTGPATLTVTSFTCNSTNTVLTSVDFAVTYSDGSTSPAVAPLFIVGVTANGQLGQTYSFGGFDGNVSTLPVADNATRQVYFVWDFRAACAAPVTPPAPTAPVAPTLPNQTATVGTAFNYVVPAFTGTAPISYSATITPANSLSFDANTRTISGTPSMTGVSTVVISASNSVGTSTGQFTITVSASATQPTGPATLTITSFTCNSTNGALSSVDFTVTYSDGSTSPAVGPLFINGVTDNGQLGQTYSFGGFDGNVSTLSVADNANRANVYFVWNFRTACATPSPTRIAAEPVAPLGLRVLGNPVGNLIEVEVTGAQGYWLEVVVTDQQGRSLDQQRIEQAGTSETLRFNITSQSGGILLIRASTSTQGQTIKVLKQ